MMPLRTFAFLYIASLPLLLSACLGAAPSEAPLEPLHISELQASNGGVAIDERGETDDWIELHNRGVATVNLSDYAIGDGMSEPVRLPDFALPPGEAVLLWADDDPEQGSHHLPFKLSASGDRLDLYRDGFRVDGVTYDSMGENESLARLPGQRAFVSCRYPSPGRPNPEACVPPSPPDLTDIHFTDAPLEPDFPASTSPLVIAEAALRPARFVELANRSNATLALDDYTLSLASHGPGLPWPAADEGELLVLPAGRALEPGDRIDVEVKEAHLASLTLPEFEGVLTLAASTGEVVDRVDFMRWPEGAALTREDLDRDRLRFCQNASPGGDEPCQPVPSRDVGDRVRHLRTPADFAALAAGADELGVLPVKCVIDLQAGGVTHLLSAQTYPLHYTFVREAIDGDPALDRCDPAQAAEFQTGWVRFSRQNYFVVEGRRYLLATYHHYTGPDLWTFEYALGDAISPAQMAQGFRTAMRQVENPADFLLRPQDEAQVAKARALEGELPIVGPNAPFVGIRFQGMAEGVGYGTLRFVPGPELATAELGPRVILVTDEVPNDLPFVGGLITEAFQTPLAHVNVLSRGRNTPNMALRGARSDARVAPLLDKLVKLTVDAGGFELSEADPQEAEAFFASQVPDGPVVAPRLDTSVRDLLPLDGSVGYESLPTVGAKAAQLGELVRVVSSDPACAGPVPIPHAPFAIPLVHSLEHFERSGAHDLLDTLLDDPSSTAAERAQILNSIQERIMGWPVDPDLLQAVEAAVEERHGQARVRFRSSSNTEDLPAFNGAGIYTSTSAELGDPSRSVADAMRTVWASLWNARAFDEREFARIDHRKVAMGILVHNAFLSEQANGVGISRNILAPTRGDQHYFNLQFGEASVTNPAPGISTEAVIYQRPPRAAQVTYQSQSSLRDGHVLTVSEIALASCYLNAIHDHFQTLLHPDQSDAWFAMDTEIKWMGTGRAPVFKQARPYSFGGLEPIGDCREF